jgi:hypothetical protein
MMGAAVFGGWLAGTVAEPVANRTTLRIATQGQHTNKVGSKNRVASQKRYSELRAARTSFEKSGDLFRV